MREFALRTLNDYLDQVIYCVAAAIKSHDHETVHKLRVAVRRMQQALRLFGSYLDKHQSKRVRKQLRRLLDAAAEVRNRDIAEKLLTKMGAPEEVIDQVHHKRKHFAQELHLVARNESRHAEHWRNRLALDGRQ